MNVVVQQVSDRTSWFPWEPGKRTADGPTSWFTWEPGKRTLS